MMRPLEKITVLDLTPGRAGALVSMILADLGARTLRAVYAEAQLFRKGEFIVWDRGKEAITLDVPTPDGQLELDRLLPGIDVLIEDFAPSSPLQALVDMERLLAINPRLVACSITAFGKHGPLKDTPPIDDLVMARTGLLGSVPGFRGTPVHLVHRLPSVGAALTAYYGIGTSLLAREDTGRGRKVETSLMAGALVYTPKCVGERINRQLFQHHPCGTEPFFGVYQCSDGRYLNPGCVHGGFIAACAEMLGLSDLLAEPRFNHGRMGMAPEAEQELRDAIAAVFKTRPAAEWAEALTTVDVPFAHVFDDEACLDDPQALANGSVVTFEDPQFGSVTQVGTPSRFFETPAAPQGPRAAEAETPPLSDTTRPKVKPLSVLGEQTAEVLAEAELTETEIKMMFDNGSAVAEAI